MFRLKNVSAWAALAVLIGSGFESAKAHSLEIPELLAEFEGLTPVEMRRASEKALIEAHLRGEVLVTEFQRLLDQGLTLDEIQVVSPVYSRLQALRYLRESLEASIEESFENQVALGLPYSEVIREVRDVSKELGVREKVLPHVFGDLPLHASAFAPLKSLSPSEVRADLAQLEQADRLIQVDAFIEDIAQQIELEKKVSLATTPKPATLVHYPDLGPAGNMVGGTFPKGVWALTYDDGPGEHTETLLRELQRRKVLATFFVQGGNFSSFPGVVKRIREAGHTVASHSYSHPLIPNLSEEGRRRQITQAVRELETVLGEKTRFFRLPYGAGVNTASVRQLIKDSGLIHAFWNVDTLDWQIKTVSGIVDNSMKQIRALQAKGLNRGMILFHDVHQRTVGSSSNGQFSPGASLQVLDELLKDPAVRFLTLDEIVQEVNQR